LEWIKGIAGLIEMVDPFEFVIGVASEHGGRAHRIVAALIIVVIAHHIFYF
jgi:hypothetical protein